MAVARVDGINPPVAALKLNYHGLQRRLPGGAAHPTEPGTTVRTIAKPELGDRCDPERTGPDRPVRGRGAGAGNVGVERHGVAACRNGIGRNGVEWVGPSAERKVLGQVVEPRSSCRRWPNGGRG